MATRENAKVRGGFNGNRFARHSVDVGGVSDIALQPSGEFRDRFAICLEFNDDTAVIVFHPSQKLQLMRQSVNEGAKSYALDAPTDAHSHTNQVPLLVHRSIVPVLRSVLPWLLDAKCLEKCRGSPRCRHFSSSECQFEPWREFDDARMLTER